MKKEKGFTLIELLAVIVILAIIALIAVPQVLKILNNARKSAAEDSVYGIVKASENYIASFMLNNNGSYPNQDLVFECGNDGCKLKEEIKDELNNKNYELTNLEILDYKGTKATKGTVTISSNGKDIKVTNLLINGFTCTYENEKASCNKSGNTTTTTTTTTTPVVPTYYYEFGAPTTSSKTDYTTIGKNVFARLGSDNSKGVCINDGGLFCINTNDYDNSVVALKAHFGESNCTARGSGVVCLAGYFGCYADSYGHVHCDDGAADEGCDANSVGSFYCDCYE